jgi:hypothetical protein
LLQSRLASDEKGSSREFENGIYGGRIGVRRSYRVLWVVALAMAGAAGGRMLGEAEQVTAAPDALLGGMRVPGFGEERLDAGRFRALHSAVAPGGERWTTIPWEPDLGQARARAAREGKPLLMWVMDGHPLGCT